MHSKLPWYAFTGQSPPPSDGREETSALFAVRAASRPSIVSFALLCLMQPHLDSHDPSNYRRRPPDSAKPSSPSALGRDAFSTKQRHRDDEAGDCFLRLPYTCRRDASGGDERERSADEEWEESSEGPERGIEGSVSADVEEGGESGAEGCRDPVGREMCPKSRGDRRWRKERGERGESLCGRGVRTSSGAREGSPAASCPL